VDGSRTKRMVSTLVCNKCDMLVEIFCFNLQSYITEIITAIKFPFVNTTLEIDFTSKNLTINCQFSQLSYKIVRGYCLIIQYYFLPILSKSIKI